jgi:hypothetical protein
MMTPFTLLMVSELTVLEFPFNGLTGNQGNGFLKAIELKSLQNWMSLERM